MKADNETIGSDWRGWGVRTGLVSMMAATGMVLAGHAADATTTVESLKAQADGVGQGQADGTGQNLPLDLSRIVAGNSGAICGAMFAGAADD